MKNLARCVSLLACLALMNLLVARAAAPFVVFTPEEGGFTLAENGEMAAVVNLSTDQGIEMAIQSVREDLFRVSGASDMHFGIGGNCLTMRCLGPSGHNRWEHEFGNYCAKGSGFVLFIGVNDIGNSSDTAATYKAMCNEYRRMIKETRMWGPIYACTILPFKGHYYYTPEHEALRQRINMFIREEAGFDAVIDTDAYMADPNNPEQLNPLWHDGDWLHPNALGHKLLGEYIANELLKIYNQ